VPSDEWHALRGRHSGSFEHQDSKGGGGLITGGDNQWMTAGAGIHHIEAPTEQLVVSGGLIGRLRRGWRRVRLPNGNPPMRKRSGAT